MKRNEIIPVVISALVIVLVAVLQNQSRLVAAVTATMPQKSRSLYGLFMPQTRVPGKPWRLSAGVC